MAETKAESAISGTLDAALEPLATTAYIALSLREGFKSQALSPDMLAEALRSMASDLLSEAEHVERGAGTPERSG